MRSPIFWNASLYRAALRAVYGGALEARWRILAPLVNAGERVVDLGAGDGEVVRHLPPVVYVPVDANEVFVRRLARLGHDARQLDVRTDALPEGDVVMMLGALCHQVPRCIEMVERMKAAARRLVIVAEPHTNWSSRGGVLGRFAQAASDPGVAGAHLGRLGCDEIERIAQQTGATKVVSLPRELVVVWDRSG